MKIIRELIFEGRHISDTNLITYQQPCRPSRPPVFHPLTPPYSRPHDVRERPEPALALPALLFRGASSLPGGRQQSPRAPPGRLRRPQRHLLPPVQQPRGRGAHRGRGV